jgi:hypothetical protein
MPLDKPERYGRIKDAVPWVMGTADAKVQQLNNLGGVVTQVDQLKSLLAQAQYHLDKSGVVPSIEIASIGEGLRQADAIIDSIKASLSGDSVKDATTENNEKNEIFSSGIDFF